MIYVSLKLFIPYGLHFSFKSANQRILECSAKTEIIHFKGRLAGEQYSYFTKEKVKARKVLVSSLRPHSGYAAEPGIRTPVIFRHH